MGKVQCSTGKEVCVRMEILLGSGFYWVLRCSPIECGWPGSDWNIVVKKKGILDDATMGKTLD